MHAGEATLCGYTRCRSTSYTAIATVVDRLSDLTSGDTIDLSALGVTTFKGALASPGAVGAHEFGYINSGGTTTIYVDTDGVFGADLEIILSNTYVPVATDFTL